MKSAAELQHEAETTRRGLSSTLDDLRDSATPGNLTQEALYLAKDTGLSIVRTLADTTRRHPIPAALIGAGIFMMMTQDGGSDRKTGSHDTGLLDKTGSVLKGAAQSSAHAARTAAQVVGDAAGSAIEAVKGAASSSANAVTEAADKMKTAVEGDAEQLQDKVDSPASEPLVNQARGAIAKLIDEQPLVAAALGVALGAAIGAALPATAAEKEYLGKASAKIRKAGQEILSKVSEAATAEAEAQGLDTDAVREVVSEVSEKVKTVADKAVDTLAEGLTSDRAPEPRVARS